MAPRLIVGLVALLAAAWLLLSLFSARAERRAFNVGFSGPKTTHAQNLAGIRDARAARRLVPDAPAKLLEWQILARDGRRAEAERLLRGVVALEPRNYDAWLFLSRSTRDPRLARLAKQRVAELGIPR